MISPSVAIAARCLLAGIGLALSSLPESADADTEPPPVRLGTLVPVAISPPEEGLRQGLSELGYIEGKNLTIERRPADTKDAFQAGAADLVRSKVDVIVAFGTPAAQAALGATSTIPVVFLSGDPVGGGLVASLARPGANGTGVSTLTIELAPKRLELLQQIAPRTRRVVVLGNPSSPVYAGFLKEAQGAARRLRIQIVILNATNESELDVALHGVQRTTADAFMASQDALFLTNKKKIAAAVTKAKLPAIFPSRDYHGAAVLMSYGTNLKEMGRQTAVYVDKILKGARPADLPIEEASKFELVIDLRVAHELDLKVPPKLLFRADEVIR